MAKRTLVSWAIFFVIFSLMSWRGSVDAMAAERLGVIKPSGCVSKLHGHSKWKNS